MKEIEIERWRDVEVRKCRLCGCGADSPDDYAYIGGLVEEEYEWQVSEYARRHPRQLNRWPDPCRIVSMSIFELTALYLYHIQDWPDLSWVVRIWEMPCHEQDIEHIEQSIEKQRISLVDELLYSAGWEVDGEHFDHTLEWYESYNKESNQDDTYREWMGRVVEERRPRVPAAYY